MDGTTAALVSDSANHPLAVVLCSAPASPDMQERATSRALRAKALLGETLGSPILRPLVTGRANGLSYAVMPYCDRLSEVRPYRWLQNVVLRPSLLDWIWEANKCSVSDVPPDQVKRWFWEPLRLAESFPALGSHVKSAAKDAIARLESGAWTPKHVLMHGDLWKGNILLRPREDANGKQRWSDRFVVIDWPGSEIRGYAIYDLVRLAQSVRLGASGLRRELNRHCSVLQCQRADAKAYLLAALGHIASRLESFPAASFGRMAEASLVTIEHAI